VTIPISDCVADESTGVRHAQDPHPSPVTADPGAGQPGTGREDPATASRLPSRPGRGRTRSPAGGVPATGSASLAGSTGLRGAEFRKAVADAQRKTRRRTPAAKPSVTLPGLPAGSVPLVATAHCIAPCAWTAGPGTASVVDRAAEKHVGVGHSTVTIATPGAAA
jgi:hypothetical protein